MNVLKKVLFALMFFAKKHSSLVSALFNKVGIEKKMKAYQKTCTIKWIEESVGFMNGMDIIVRVTDDVTNFEEFVQNLQQVINPSQHSLFFVDDGCSPTLQKAVVSASQKLQGLYLRNSSTIGFAVSLTQAIKKGRRQWILHLDPSYLPSQENLKALLLCAHSRDSVGAAGPITNRFLTKNAPSLNQRNSVEKIVSQYSYRLYPDVEELDSHFFLINREAYSKIGPFTNSKASTAQGALLEFLKKSKALGFKNILADDIYIFTHPSASAKGAFKIEVQNERALIALFRVQELLCQGPSVDTPIKSKLIERYKPTLIWMCPHLELKGGIRRIIEMTNRLLVMGYDVTIATVRGERSYWLPILAKVVKISDVLHESPDILICSDPSEALDFLKIKSSLKVCYHLAAYNLYRNQDSQLQLFYSMPKDVIHIVNSKWTGEQFPPGHPKPEGIFPGAVRLDSFRPLSIKTQTTVVYYGSDRPHKGTPLIEEAIRGLDAISLEGKSQSQFDLVQLINAGKVFVSACQHEGFNFMPLEAMACGIPVVTTDDGGSREYVKDRINCLVVPTFQAQDLRKAIDEVLNNPALRRQLILEGLKTAEKFQWDRLTEDFSNFILSRLPVKAPGAF